MVWPHQYESHSLYFATKLDTLSFASCLIQAGALGTTVQASGFFWRHAENVFLITNWHVVTGLHGFSGQSLRQGWVPEMLLVTGWRRFESENGTVNFQDFQTRISLYVDFHAPLWVQHASFGQHRVDMVAVQVPVDFGASIVCVNDYGFERLFHPVGADIFVVGHPLLPTSGPVQSIWKRGSVATEIMMPWNGAPAFLIDCRTSGGMSGAPCYRRTFGPATHHDLTMNLGSVVATEFMGIYSGRLLDNDDNASIGIVWSKQLLEEMLSHPSPGARA